MRVATRFGNSPRLIQFINVVIVSAVAAAALPVGAADGPRVVAIGEVQGAYESVVKTLRAAELVDDQLHWSGGDAVVVQTGDLIDDGTRVRDVMDLFMRLQDEAEAAGGKVIVLLGNHESLNIVGITKGVNYMTWEAFADDDSAAKQAAAYEQHVALERARAEALGAEAPTIDDAHRSDWMLVHPLGWVEYVEAMRPAGVYGRWLRTLPAAVKIGDAVFIHGGISPALTGQDVDTINRKVAEEIAQFDSYRAAMVDAGLVTPFASGEEMARAIKAEIRYLSASNSKKKERNRMKQALELQDFQHWSSWYLVRHDGPMWFEGPAEWDEAETEAQMAEMLDGIGAEVLVSGQSNGKPPKIEARYDGRVLLTSTGMSDDPYVKSEPACVEIEDDGFIVISPNGRQALVVARK